MGGHVHVLHAALQTRLNGVWIPPKDPHHHSPTQARKDGPRIALYPFPHLPAWSKATFTLFYHRNLGQRQNDACKDVDDDLLIDATLDASPKHQVAPSQTRKKGVHR